MWGRFWGKTTYQNRRPHRRSWVGSFDRLEGRALMARLEVLAPGGVAAMATSWYPLEQAAHGLGEQSFGSDLWVGHMYEDSVTPAARVGLGYLAGLPSYPVFVPVVGPSLKYFQFETEVNGFADVNHPPPIPCIARVGTSQSGSVGDIGTPVTIKVQPEGGEKDGDPVVVRLDASILGHSDGNTTTHYQVMYQAQGVGGTLLYGPDSSAPIGYSNKSVTFDSSVGQTFQVVLELSTQGTITSELGVGRRVTLDFAMQLVQAKPDLALTSLAWNTTNGGLDFGYTISTADLPHPPAIAIYWASGTTSGTTIGDPIATPTATKTQQGASESFHVTPAQLGTPPRGAKYLLAVVNPAGANHIPESDETNGTDPNDTAYLPLPSINYLSTTTFVTTDSITLHASVGVPTAGVPVTWTVQGRDAAANIAGFPTNFVTTTDATGTATFKFTPSDNANLVNDRRINWTRGNRAANPAISFEVTAKSVIGGTEFTSRLSDTNLGPLTQDEIDRLRQEYYDYNIPVPARGEVVPSLGVNQGNYGVQLSVGLDDRYNAILAAYRGRHVTVTIDGQQYATVIPDNATLTISSGYRNPQRNRAANSRFPDSRHTRGRALDLVPGAVQVVIMVNGHARRVVLPLYDTLYPALYAAASTVGAPIYEHDNQNFHDQVSGTVDGQEIYANHVHVQW